jgi:hypothetical protein
MREHASAIIGASKSECSHYPKTSRAARVDPMGRFVATHDRVETTRSADWMPLGSTARACLSYRLARNRSFEVAPG